eukprot:TRINITY_DN43441_c0_g3_i1.p1 TRINITY_DN43441_c0_g3~~TRINITY_DN43441_c0_g3_i1.p1  ORF type:complete len:1227 (+),score=262.78 TRINITY_DN43441_c0_g3_i1:143-3823(+)
MVPSPDASKRTPVAEGSCSTDVVGGRLFATADCAARRLSKPRSETACGPLGRVRSPGASKFVLAALSEDGSLAAAVTDAGNLFLMHLDANRYAHLDARGLVVGRPVTPGALGFSPAGSEALVGLGTDVVVIDVKSRETVGHLRGHNRCVTRLLSRAQCGLLLSMSRDTAFLWDCTTAARWWAKPYCSLRMCGGGTGSWPSGGLTSAELGPTGVACLVSSDGVAQLWTPAAAPSGRCLPVPAVKLDQRRCAVQQVAVGWGCMLVLLRAQAAAEATAADADANIGRISRSSSTSILVCWQLESQALVDLQLPESGDCKDVVELPDDDVSHISVRQLAGGVLGEKARDVAFCFSATAVSVILASSLQVLQRVPLHSASPCSWPPCALAVSPLRASVIHASLTADGHLELSTTWTASPVGRVQSGVPTVAFCRRSVTPPRVLPKSASGLASKAKLQHVDISRLDLERAATLLPPSLQAPKPAEAAARLLEESTAKLERQGARKSGTAAPQVQELCELLASRMAFPERQRPSAWRILLSLPRNVEAHSSLLARGQHPAATSMLAASEPEGLGQGQARRRLLRTLSALLHWAPELSGVSFLPRVVQPLARVFGGDDVLAFEAAVTFLHSWGCRWLDGVPGPPLGAIVGAAAQLRIVDGLLYKHLLRCATGRDGSTMEACSGSDFVIALSVLWPLLENLLSEVLGDVAWASLWDHLVSRWREPDLLGACAVACVRRKRKALMALAPGKAAAERLAEEILRPLTLKGPAATLVSEADRILKSCRCEGADSAACATGLPLPAGLSYPPLLLERPPSRLADRVAEVQSRLQRQYEEVARPKELRSLLEEGRQQLQQAELELTKHVAAMANAREECYAHAAKDAGRFFEANRLLDDETQKLRERLAEGLDVVVQEAMERQAKHMEGDKALLEEELKQRKARREQLEEISEKEQVALNAAEEKLQKLLGQLEEARSQATTQHVGRYVELQRATRAAWAGVERQRLDGENECSRVRLMHGLRRRDEALRAEELARLQRRAEVDLDMEGFEREQDVARVAQLKRIERTELLGEVLSQDAARLQERRQQLAEDIDGREKYAADAREEASGNERRRRWIDLGRAADADQARREVEWDLADEMALRESAKTEARQRMEEQLRQDAQSSQQAEARFRRALLELDRLRRAGDFEGLELIGGDSEESSASPEPSASDPFLHSTGESGRGPPTPSMVEERFSQGASG